MTLSDFIEDNLEELLDDWEEFAHRAQPDDADLDREELRDWADGVLRAIAEEMRTPEVDAALERRSKQLRPTDAPGITRAARVHAMDRLAQGFNIDQVLSEFRSLRTSVSLKWQARSADDDIAVSHLTRFDEALDHALAESARCYTTSLERTRDLFTAAVGHDLRTPLSSIRNTAEAFLLAPEQLSSYHVAGTVRIRNATRIGQMLSNLVSNALKHGRQDTPVTITVSTSNSDILFQVHNEGKPIPGALKNAIFQPLHRGHRTSDAERQPEGLGLGLYIARQIAEAHGGDLDFSSSEDDGTTFEACVARRES